MTTPEKEQRIAWVMSSRDQKEVAERYDSWAQDYEADVVSFGYTLPAVIVGLLCRHITPGDGPILDAGVGTGIMGELLRPLGYGDVVGLDLSQGMLEVARRKGVYRELHQMPLGYPLSLPDNAFSAVVSSGVFVRGHAPAESFDELARVTKPGGAVIFSIRPELHRDGGFKEKQNALEARGTWKLTYVTEPFHALPLSASEGEAFNLVFVYQVQ